jgi:hypothetical protein
LHSGIIIQINSSATVYNDRTLATSKLLYIVLKNG